MSVGPALLPVVHRQTECLATRVWDRHSCRSFDAPDRSVWPTQCGTGTPAGRSLRQTRVSGLHECGTGTPAGRLRVWDRHSCRSVQCARQECLAHAWPHGPVTGESRSCDSSASGRCHRRHRLRRSSLTHKSQPREALQVVEGERRVADDDAVTASAEALLFDDHAAARTARVGTGQRGGDRFPRDEIARRFEMEFEAGTRGVADEDIDRLAVEDFDRRSEALRIPKPDRGRRRTRRD